jgi:hypothetical protein
VYKRKPDWDRKHDRALKYRVSKKSTGKGKCEYMTWKGFKAALERRRVVD